MLKKAAIILGIVSTLITAAYHIHQFSYDLGNDTGKLECLKKRKKRGKKRANP